MLDCVVYILLYIVIFIYLFLLRMKYNIFVYNHVYSFIEIASDKCFSLFSSEHNYAYLFDFFVKKPYKFLSN